MPSFYDELRHRNVIRVTIAYIAMAWLMIQVADTILPAFEAPDWFLRVLIIVLAAGLFVVIPASWVFELTPKGIRRTDELPADYVVPRRAGRKIDLAIIVILSLALTTVVIDQYILDRSVAPPVSTMAVLPLENVSGSPDKAYFVNGMTDALISNLSKISALRVTSRNSVMRFKDSDRSLPAIAAELDVDAILTGSAALNNDRLQISVQLVDVSSDIVLWGETFDREFEDVFKLQSEIASTIADRIRVDVTADELAQLSAVAESSTDGYDDILRGMERFYRLTPQDLEIAIDYFDRALEQNPDSALALSGIAAAWVGLQQMGFVSPSIAAPNSEAASLRALEVDPTLAAPHQWLAVIRAGIDYKWEEADELFIKAIDLNPNYSDARTSYAHFLAARGQFEEAFEQSEISIELDPFNGWVLGVAGVIRYQANRLDDAARLLERALKVSPDLPFVWLVLAGVYQFQNRFEDAIKSEASLLSAFGRVDERDELLRIFREEGFESALIWLSELTAANSSAVNAQGTWVAFRYARAGDTENAIRWLLIAYEQADPNVVFLRMPEFEPLHRDPRIQELMVKLGIQ